MTRIAALFLTVALGATTPAVAQDAETLADIRQDLSALAYELQSLRREMSTTGASDVSVAGSTIDRVNQIEQAMQQLTSRTEELQNRIDRVVSDGTNRIGDLKFRLCELEEGCDIGALDQEDPLGGLAPATSGSAAPAGGSAAPAPATGGTETATAGAGAGAGTTGAASGGGASDLPIADPNLQLAAAEEQDYRRAASALEAGEYQSAADQFEAFRQTYPGGPLDAAARLGQGRAFEGLDNTREAARAYLDVYSGSPDTPVAPEALWRLGAALAELGSTREACVTLAEVSNRYPDSDAVARAQEARSGLTCP
ncbi:tol-pal system protein YbgF [Roseivivax marinus]|uniref:tol-pal system protein YbgF n=1 Tax=Roseivivax marinus TaxID=1379903 RepID=UPI0008B5FEE7|nr:tol-pal system protein YbgF [Roseivivax marinus]SEK31821.1 tol-pal system protein YbgF [Roseivivax marinus]